MAICAFLVAGFAIAIMLILRGTENSLRLANDRLGADIIVVPEGTTTKVETALLMGNPTEVWMPQSNLTEDCSDPRMWLLHPLSCISRPLATPRVAQCHPCFWWLMIRRQISRLSPG